jgi:thiol:disulfide interchange protein
VRTPPLIVATVAAFVFGAGLLFAFEKAVTLAVGVMLLFAFVVLGVFAIATPEYLARAADQSELPEDGSKGP